jgi:hypothetical protein
MWKSLLNLESNLFTRSLKIDNSLFFGITRLMSQISSDFNLRFRTESLAKCLLFRYTNLGGEIKLNNALLSCCSCIYLVALISEENNISMFDMIELSGNVFGKSDIREEISKVSHVIGGTLLYPSHGYFIEVMMTNSQLSQNLDAKVFYEHYLYFKKLIIICPTGLLLLLTFMLHVQAEK